MRIKGSFLAIRGNCGIYLTILDAATNMTDDNKKPKKIIIEGVTDDGKTFRPSDWAERVSGQLSTFKNHRIYYSPMLRPSYSKGNRCVILDPALKDTNPELYKHILDFAIANKLKICGEEENEQSNESNNKEQK